MDQQEPNTDLEKFQDLARKLVQVPKAEADEKEREYQQKRKGVKKKTARRKKARKAH